MNREEIKLEQFNREEVKQQLLEYLADHTNTLADDIVKGGADEEQTAGTILDFAKLWQLAHENPYAAVRKYDQEHSGGATPMEDSLVLELGQRNGLLDFPSLAGVRW